MNRLYRIVLFSVAMYMYYLFIIDNKEPLEAISKIILVALLLVAMEVVRKGSSKIFNANSKLDELDKMDQDKFVRYIAELYKRQGYQVFVLQEEKKLGCDLKAYKGKESLCIKCVPRDEENLVDRDVISEAYSSIKLYKVKKCVIITNSAYTESAQEVASVNQIRLVDRIELHNLIYKVISKRDRNEEMINPQEA